MKKISLTQNKYALVDDKDFEHLSLFKWYLSDTGYALYRSVVCGKKKTIRMHRAILNVPDGKFTDHRNGNKLDNRRANLRICTKSQNEANAGKYKCNKSGFKGVYMSRCGNWYAKIKRSIHLGTFSTKEQAALAYNKAARSYFGEFANLNKIT